MNSWKLFDLTFKVFTLYILGKAMLQNATFMKFGICIALIFRKTDVQQSSLRVRDHAVLQLLGTNFPGAIGSKNVKISKVAFFSFHGFWVFFRK